MRRKRARWAVVAATAGGALLLMAGPAAADPAGNNGTIKVDNTPFDHAPDNQPHVGCQFQIDFYGFDAGTGNVAGVEFALQPPTGVQVLLTDTVPIGEDSNAGGGSEDGLDAERTYDLSDELEGFTPEAQGFHVKLTIHADGSQGADVKHKVFWVTGCVPGGQENPPPVTPPVETPPPVTPPVETPPPVTPPVETPPPVTPPVENPPPPVETPPVSPPPAESPPVVIPSAAQAPPEVLGETIERQPVVAQAAAPATTANVGTRVLGETITRTPQSLPRTGGELLPELLLGLSLIGSGTGSLFAGRRRARRG